MTFLGFALAFGLLVLFVVWSAREIGRVDDIIAASESENAPADRDGDG